MERYRDKQKIKKIISGVYRLEKAYNKVPIEVLLRVLGRK